MDDEKKSASDKIADQAQEIMRSKPAGVQAADLVADDGSHKAEKLAKLGPQEAAEESE